jgi:glycosyltransferase involved in cell wall biosynthesis
LLLSVIIVTKNPGNDLYLTLASLGPLNLRSVEIILKDNSDKEDLSEINSLFQFLNFRFIHSEDMGIYDAMNQALSEANGKYVYFLNAGDQYININLPELLQNADDNIGYFYGNVIVLHPRTKFIRFSNYMNRYLIFLKNLNHQGIIFNKSVFDNVGYYDTDFKVGGDLLLTLRMSKYYPGRKIRKFLSVYKGAGISYQYKPSSFEKKMMKIRLKEIFNPLELTMLTAASRIITGALTIKNRFKF